MLHNLYFLLVYWWAFLVWLFYHMFTSLQVLCHLWLIKRNTTSQRSPHWSVRQMWSYMTSFYRFYFGQLDLFPVLCALPITRDIFCHIMDCIHLFPSITAWFCTHTGYPCNPQLPTSYLENIFPMWCSSHVVTWMVLFYIGSVHVINPLFQLPPPPLIITDTLFVNVISKQCTSYWLTCIFATSSSPLSTQNLRYTFFGGEKKGKTITNISKV